MTIIGLIDIDSMFASCERVFNPVAANKPTLVLSNNDGCVIAASKEAKLLGIKIGMPFFEIKYKYPKNFFAVFSSNFELYADLSKRFYGMIKDRFSNVEQYSIDECFFNLPLHCDIISTIRQLKQDIFKGLGFPVTVGVAKTKTLAKVAVYLAKQNPDFNGILNLYDLSQLELQAKLRQVEVEHIWGIGKRLVPKFYALGCENAFDVSLLDPLLVRKRFSVILERTVRELAGQSCLCVGFPRVVNKTLLYSRHLASADFSLTDLENILDYFVSQIVRKLQKINRYATKIVIRLSNSRFKTNYTVSARSLLLNEPTQNQIIILKVCKQLLREQYQPHIHYNRILVYLPNLVVDSNLSLLPSSTIPSELTKVINTIKSNYGESMIDYATAGIRNFKVWKQQNYLSARATTKMNEIIKVK